MFNLHVTEQFSVMSFFLKNLSNLDYVSLSCSTFWLIVSGYTNSNNQVVSVLFKVKWLMSLCRLLGWPLDYVPAAACLMRADAENTDVSSQQNCCGDEKQATEVGQQTTQKKWSKFLHLPEYHKTRSLASLRHFTPMKEITLVRCSSHSKSSDDRFTAKAFLDGILIRKPRQDGVLVSVISIFRLYVESDGRCSLWETKTYRETRYSRWSLGDSPCGIMQVFFLSLFLSCLSGSACRRWAAIRLVSHRTKTNVSQQAAGSERIES